MFKRRVGAVFVVVCMFALEAGFSFGDGRGTRRVIIIFVVCVFRFVCLLFVLLCCVFGSVLYVCIDEFRFI